MLIPGVSKRGESPEGNASGYQNADEKKKGDRARGVTFGGSSVVTVEAVPLEPWTNIRRDHFKTIESLGHGGYGEVKLVQYTHDGNLYALKCIEKSHIRDRQHGGDNKVVESVMAERNFGVLSQQWNCPFVIKLFATFQSAAKLYYVLEFCPGGELFSLLCAQECGYFHEADARFYIGEITLALAHLHEHDVIHRDVKLENTLISRDGHIKLADFGCVRAELPMGGTKSFVFATMPDIFMPPEFRNGEAYGKELDCWQLGVASCAMLTGAYPKSGTGELPDLPSETTPMALCLCSALLCETREQRLGYPEGAGMVRSHDFFQGFDWDGLLCCSMSAPFKCTDEEPSPETGMSIMHLRSTRCGTASDLLRLRGFTWAVDPDNRDGTDSEEDS